ncbi:efflux RND transporter permease subunit [Spirochaeta africana]|uniref:Cation/multidrug efflux pump n=1 Tax=Spirochaeta africana (strain ATCC 700263 / DSM 8902 / Z-7692) TaxID=889378 RepID=H9UM71_SPIAZ|nr:efflux RND transporter permease subunit [Spirochaeta africana]AFG38614.1 cation/multidrug efflux pump [Spirochaeta africana DSM 8902]
MTIGDFSVRNPVLVNILTVLLLVIGLLSVIRLPQEQFSEVPFFFINITVPYPGVSAEDIEATVTTRVETAMQGLDQLSTVQSVTSDGVAAISLQFDQGITRREFDRVFQEAQNRYNALSLPDGVAQAQISEFSSNDFLPVIEVVLYGDRPYEELNRTAKRLADRIEGVREVSGVNLVGSRDPVIMIEPDQQQLERLGISLDQVVQSLQARNVTIPGGSLTTPSRSLLLRTVGEIQSAEDFAQVILRTGEDGQTVRVGDVATTRQTFDNEGLAARFNGRSAISLRITKVPGGSSVGIIEDVRVVVDQFQEQGFAEGLEIVYFNDSTVQIRDSINVLVTNAVFGLILLVAILLVFVGMRNALMAALGIPVTFAVTFIILEYLGETLNSNTLFGLVLVLGLVVDHAIVIVENSFRLQQQGLSKHQAAIRGVNQVAIPVWAATATTVAAFLPLTFLPGIIGRFLRVVPLTVSIALVVSTLEATVFLPSHYADWPGKLRETRMARWIDGLQDRFARLLTALYRRRKRVLLVTAAIMIGTFSLVGQIRQNLFDAEDFSVFFIDIQMPAGTPIQQTDRVVRQFEQELMPLIGQGEVRAVNAYVGFSAGDNENVSDATVGQIIVDLLEREEGRTRPVPAVLRDAEALTRHIPGAEQVRYRTQQTGPPVDPPLSFRLFGNSFDQLEAAASEIREELQQIEGVFDVRDNLLLSSPELRIIVDDFQAARYGLSRAQIGNFVRAAFDGVDAGSVFIDNEEIGIRVRYDLPVQMTYDRFAQLRIPAPDGRSIPFDAVASIEDSEVLSSIRRLDGRREVTIEAEALPEVDLRRVNREIEELFFTQISPEVPDVQLDVGGQFAEFGTLLFDILRVFLIGVFLIYLILATQFRSYTQPILIMFSVPFAFVGVILFLLMTGTPLSTTVIYAGVALAGIAVNDSIVLISFINEERRDGMATAEAVIQGAVARLRPILLTSLTTIAGLLPIALGIGGRSVVWSPMAGTIVFGLLFSTITALIIIPCIYGLFYDRRSRGKGTGRKMLKSGENS